MIARSESCSSPQRCGVRQTGNLVSLWRKFCQCKENRNSPQRHPGREVAMPQRTEIAPLVIPANAGI